MIWDFSTPLNSIEARSPEFILEDFLPIARRKVTMLSAPGGSGKSFVAIQAGLRYAAQGKRVGMWLTEDEIGEIRERADLICQRILQCKKIPDTLFAKGAEEQIAAITAEDGLAEAIIEAWKDFDLIVLDPLIGFYAGSENDNALAKQFMAILTRAAVVNDLAILVIHHHTKANAEGETSTRGASAFVDAARILYTLHYDKESQTHRLRLDKDNVNAKKFRGREFEVRAIPFDLIIEEEPAKQTTIGGIDDDF